MHDDEPLDALIAALADALAAGTLAKLVLGKPRAAADDLVRVTVRPVALKGQTRLSFVYTHRTRDITKNLVPDEGSPYRGAL